MKPGVSRRTFLKSTGSIAVGLVAPPWLASVAKADMVRLNKGQGLNPDAVLVVCQLSGGNDGLNTVIPVGSDAYYKARPSLAIGKDQALALDSGLALHPEMGPLKDLYGKGQVAIIQSVGYPNSNRSHFRSMDIWHTASPDDELSHGWIGRQFDITQAQAEMSAVAGLGLSREKPRALSAQNASIPCFASLADIGSLVGDPETERLLREIQGTAAEAGSTRRLIQQASGTALDAMSLLKSRLDTYKTAQSYDDNGFSNGFKQIGHLIAVSPETRVVYFSHGGFDTHSRQAEQHGKLMKDFSGALKTFMDEMEAIGKADKVIVMVFSEFGRRVEENGSAGTDHGKAGPMMLIGKNVKGGIYGPMPELKDLDRGDVPFSIDFRQVYATALDGWLGGDSKQVLGGDFAKLDVLR